MPLALTDPTGFDPMGLGYLNSFGYPNSSCCAASRMGDGLDPIFVTPSMSSPSSIKPHAADSATALPRPIADDQAAASMSLYGAYGGLMQASGYLSGVYQGLMVFPAVMAETFFSLYPDHAVDPYHELGRRDGLAAAANMHSLTSELSGFMSVVSFTGGMFLGEGTVGTSIVMGTAVSLTSAQVAVFEAGASNTIAMMARNAGTRAQSASSARGRPPPSSDNYRGRYNAARAGNGEARLPDDWDAHHRIPQEYRTHPEFQKFDFDAPGNIRGVKGSRSNVNVHQQITNEWADFRTQFPNATRGQIENFANEVENAFSVYWW